MKKKKRKNVVFYYESAVAGVELLNGSAHAPCVVAVNDTGTGRPCVNQNKLSSGISLQVLF